jgi:hypothetical protein
MCYKSPWGRISDAREGQGRGRLQGPPGFDRRRRGARRRAFQHTDAGDGLDGVRSRVDMAALYRIDPRAGGRQEVHVRELWRGQQVHRLSNGGSGPWSANRGGVGAGLPGEAGYTGIEDIFHPARAMRNPIADAKRRALSFLLDWSGPFEQKLVIN